MKKKLIFWWDWNPVNQMIAIFTLRGCRIAQDFPLERKSVKPAEKKKDLVDFRTI